MCCRIMTCLAALLLIAGQGQAELKLSAVFSDSMVLQRDQPVKVWGTTDAGNEVTVAIAEQQQKATANASGRWEAKLTAMAAGGPHEMKVTDASGTVTVKDVLIGEVWLCSGQSNMAMTVNRAKDTHNEMAAANFPQIRMFKEASSHATEPQANCSGSWSVCSPQTVGTFSATAYFFGRRLHLELNVPIGLINSSVGGTSIESWTSMDAQNQAPAIKPRLDAWKADDDAFDSDKANAQYDKAMERWKAAAATAKANGKTAPRRPQLAVQPHLDRNYPSNLFNGKINPLVGYTIRGAIWYQGENNAGRGFASLYGDQLATLIADWRQRWGQGDFPFAWAQLPNYRAPQKLPVEDSGWVLVQDSMRKTLAIPNTGMAVTVDVGEANDIHPKDKQTVGHRLAQWALASVYGRELIPMGPIFRSAKIEGHTVTIDFDYAAGLHVADDNVVGFAIAGEDRQFVPADARIAGSTVIVSSPQVPHPKAVRYAWASNPVISLFNGANIPASPFRTDDWDVKE